MHGLCGLCVCGEMHEWRVVVGVWIDDLGMDREARWPGVAGMRWRTEDERMVTYAAGAGVCL